MCSSMLDCLKLNKVFNPNSKEIIMWTKPQATEMRFGFEVTMYVCNR
jgi:pyrroloquinoline quinone biosynthesis protein A